MEPSILHAQLLQELCATARSFRARAALRRRAELAEASAPRAASAAAALRMPGPGWVVEEQGGGGSFACLGELWGVPALLCLIGRWWPGRALYAV